MTFIDDEIPEKRSQKMSPGAKAVDVVYLRGELASTDVNDVVHLVVEMFENPGAYRAGIDYVSKRGRLRTAPKQ